MAGAMRTTRRAIGRWFICVVAACAGYAIAPSAAVRASDGQLGRAAYFKYCSSCHGDDGKGRGELAKNVKPKPADLTTLAQRHGGVFPEAEVRDILEGRTAVAAHGTAKMPVWGRVFAEEQTWEDAQAHSRSQVQLIIDHLRSIQVGSTG